MVISEPCCILITEYLYCAANRRADGTVGPAICTKIIKASTLKEAIATAWTINLDMDAIGANAVFLKAREHGPTVWTLYKDKISSAKYIDLYHNH